jgi:hypothetical protein
MSFADPLREACKVIFDLDDVQMTDRALKESSDDRWGLSPRVMMQRLGTDCIRESFGEDHWVKLMHLRLLRSDAPRVVISDVRFANEAAMIRTFPSVVVRIDRAGLQSDSHISEQCKVAVDAVFDNDSSVFHLKVQMSKLLKQTL